MVGTSEATMRQWETFTGGRAKASANSPRVTLNKMGFITLNKLAAEQLKTAKGVELLFDKETRAIGLKPSNDALALYKLRTQGNSAYRISARSFCDFYEIDISKTIAFDEISMEKDIMVLDLNKTTPIGVSKK